MQINSMRIATFAILIACIASGSQSALALSIAQETRQEDFSAFHPVYSFRGQIPDVWEVRFLPELKAVMVFDPQAPGVTPLEKSQIFIRHFVADRFLTLPTVTIHSRKPETIKRHAAVRYDIEKKKSVASFAKQPSWRSGRHTVLDIRYSTKKQSPFFVFAKNPALSDQTFEAFISSLIFYNDRESFQQPFADGRARITKKPFGIRVSPNSSPVQPEKFSGIHTGTDYEILDGERTETVVVSAICGGRVKEKKSVKGYGGVLIQECELEGKPLTVLYGHIDRSDSRYRAGDYLSPGGRVGVLARANSQESGFERTHLHLGIINGLSSDLRGYVKEKKELFRWIDPVTVLPY